MMRTIRVLALSLTLGVWATVSVDALNAKQIAQVAVHSTLVKGGIINRSSDGTINLVGSGQQRSIDCDRNTITITGNDGNVTLKGACTEVVLVGNANRVHIETVGKISVTGNNNRLTWISSMRDTSPKIVRSGNDNVVAQIE